MEDLYSVSPSSRRPTNLIDLNIPSLDITSPIDITSSRESSIRELPSIGDTRDRIPSSIVEDINNLAIPTSSIRSTSRASSKRSREESSSSKSLGIKETKPKRRVGRPRKIKTRGRPRRG